MVTSKKILLLLLWENEVGMNQLKVLLLHLIKTGNKIECGYGYNDY